MRQQVAAEITSEMSTEATLRSILEYSLTYAGLLRKRGLLVYLNMVFSLCRCNMELYLYLPLWLVLLVYAGLCHGS